MSRPCLGYISAISTHSTGSKFSRARIIVFEPATWKVTEVSKLRYSRDSRDKAEISRDIADLEGDRGLEAVHPLVHRRVPRVEHAPAEPVLTVTTRAVRRTPADESSLKARQPKMVFERANSGSMTPSASECCRTTGMWMKPRIQYQR